MVLGSVARTILIRTLNILNLCGVVSQVGDFYDDSDNEDARKNGPEASSTSTDGLSSPHAANEDLDNDHENPNVLEVQGLLPSLDTI